VNEKIILAPAPGTSRTWFGRAAAGRQPSDAAGAAVLSVDGVLHNLDPDDLRVLAGLAGTPDSLAALVLAGEPFSRRAALHAFRVIDCDLGGPSVLTLTALGRATIDAAALEASDEVLTADYDQLVRHSLVRIEKLEKQVARSEAPQAPA
jgi:hypothetical protein